MVAFQVHDTWVFSLCQSPTIWSDYLHSPVTSHVHMRELSLPEGSRWPRSHSCRQWQRQRQDQAQPSDDKLTPGRKLRWERAGWVPSPQAVWLLSLFLNSAASNWLHHILFANGSSPGSPWLGLEGPVPSSALSFPSDAL